MKNPMLVVIEKVRSWSNAQRGLALVLVAAFCLMLLGRMDQHRARVNSKAPIQPPTAEFQSLDGELNGLIGERDELEAAGRMQNLVAGDAATRQDLKQKLMVPPGVPQPFPTPLIAHSAELTVATKEFARSRGILEDILERHRGYAARLRMVGQRNGSLLSATLRVPSPELAGTVSDLKTLGEVEREEQAADEITQQRADLEARLTNAQNTLHRLQELLKKQSYPDGNVRELQRQIAAASAEVARLEADRQASEHRVVFANVQFSLREQISTPTESLGAQLKAAGASGFGEAMATLSALLVFVIGWGPVVLLWAALLFVPARFLWRKWQPTPVQSTAAATSA